MVTSGTVNAGADQSISLPSSATLSGTVTDDGLPAGALLWRALRAAGYMHVSVECRRKGESAWGDEVAARLRDDQQWLIETFEPQVKVGAAMYCHASP